jgi:hypothetical protein
VLPASLDHAEPCSRNAHPHLLASLKSSPGLPGRRLQLGSTTLDTAVLANWYCWIGFADRAAGQHLRSLCRRSFGSHAHGNKSEAPHERAQNEEFSNNRSTHRRNHIRTPFVSYGLSVDYGKEADNLKRGWLYSRCCGLAVRLTGWGSWPPRQPLPAFATQVAGSKDPRRLAEPLLLCNVLTHQE